MAKKYIIDLNEDEVSQLQSISGNIFYSFYHSSFRDAVNKIRWARKYSNAGFHVFAWRRIHPSEYIRQNQLVGDSDPPLIEDHQIYDLEGVLNPFIHPPAMHW